jgi:hypothetical protein
VAKASLSKLIVVPLILAACILLSGCNVVGAVGSKLFGNGDNPAEYTPPKEQPLLVLVENYERPGELQQPSDQLATLISDKLKELKVAPIIPTEKLIAFRTERGQDYKKLKITDIGLALHAKQIVYVNLKRFDTEGLIGAKDFRGNIDVTVRVVDVDSGQTKWPTVGDGKEFNPSSDYSPKDARDSSTTVRNTMLDDLSDNICLLFVPHEDQGNPPTD